jgi:uncharacterized protein YbjT (DUF2867 family)
MPGLALDDYGRMVNAIIDSPRNLPARRLDLGCDASTWASRAQALTAVLDRPIAYRQLPLPVVQSISTYWYLLLGAPRGAVYSCGDGRAPPPGRRSGLVKLEAA